MTSVDVGNNLFPTVDTISGNGSEYALYGSNQPWVLIGDDKFFYFFISNDNGIMQMYFGDLNSFIPADNFCAVVSRRYWETFPNNSNDYDGYLMKSLAGHVGQGIRYHATHKSEYYMPSENDIYSGNIVFAGVVFAIENNSGNASVRGCYPGALHLLAKAQSTTPFFQIKENISGFSGRVILVRGYDGRLLAFSIDNDWRL